MTDSKATPDHWKLDRDHFIHPYTDFTTFKDEGSQIIVEAKGAHVSDSDGNRFLDAIAGLWCVNIGHGRQEMADAVSRQILEMDFFNPFGHSSNAPAAELAGRLAALAPPSLNHVFFTCSGSAATDTAVRIAHFYFNMKGMDRKKRIISRVDAYHGSTFLAASLTGIQSSKQGFDAVGDLVHHVSAANLYRRPEGYSEEQYCDFLVREFEDRILQLGPDTVAAFIAEPIMGAGGVFVAPDGYHRRMYDVCKKYDMLYISDEVVTGFGRLGEMFASEVLYGIEPDIICIAKGVTSGYIPLGGTLLADEVYETIAQPQCEGGLFSHGFTYSGHAVACAAALKNLEIIESENLCDNVKKQGPYLQQQAECLMESPIVGDVRGSHFMMGVELVADTPSKQSFAPSVGSASIVAKHCMERGLIVRPIGDVIVVSPPLILGTAEVDTIVSVMRESLAVAEKELREAGLFPA